MKHPMRPILLVVPLFLASAALRPAPAQEQEPEPEPGQEQPPVVEEDERESVLPPNPFAPSKQQELQEEMLRLFAEVERNLERIDLHLVRAGLGEAELVDVPDSGLDNLLQDVNERGEQVTSDIDRILEIAQELGGT